MREDLRVIKTIEAIKQSFETLICEKDYEKIVERLIAYRNYGDEVLPKDFFEKYLPKVKLKDGDPYQKLKDIANTMLNWLDYTQLIGRDVGIIFVPEGNKNEVRSILNTKSVLITKDR